MHLNTPDQAYEGRSQPMRGSLASGELSRSKRSKGHGRKPSLEQDQFGAPDTRAPDPQDVDQYGGAFGGVQPVHLNDKLQKLRDKHALPEIKQRKTLAE